MTPPPTPEESVAHLDIEEKVKEAMVKDVVTVQPTATISEVAALMDEKRIGSVVVTEQGQIVGIISERDFVRLARIQPDFSQPVREHMTKPVVTCNASDRIIDALRLMKSKRVRHLPVIDDDDKLVGIVSLRDLIAKSQLTALYLV